jgi:hypothetical protein
MLSAIMLNVTTLNVTYKTLMQNVVMLSVVMLNVVMLTVVAPPKTQERTQILMQNYVKKVLKDRPSGQM